MTAATVPIMAFFSRFGGFLDMLDLNAMGNFNDSVIKKWFWV